MSDPGGRRPPGDEGAEWRPPAPSPDLPVERLCAESAFFDELFHKYNAWYELAVQHQYVLCVPQDVGECAGSVPYSLVKAHMLVPSTAHAKRLSKCGSADPLSDSGSLPTEPPAPGSLPNSSPAPDSDSRLQASCGSLASTPGAAAQPFSYLSHPPPWDTADAADPAAARLGVPAAERRTVSPGLALAEPLDPASVTFHSMLHEAHTVQLRGDCLISRYCTRDAPPEVVTRECRVLRSDCWRNADARPFWVFRIASSLVAPPPEECATGRPSPGPGGGAMRTMADIGAYLTAVAGAGPALQDLDMEVQMFNSSYVCMPDYEEYLVHKLNQIFEMALRDFSEVLSLSLCVCVCTLIRGCGIGSSRAPPRAVFVVWGRERFICFAQH